MQKYDDRVINIERMKLKLIQIYLIRAQHSLQPKFTQSQSNLFVFRRKHKIGDCERSTIFPQELVIQSQQVIKTYKNLPELERTDLFFS